MRALVTGATGFIGSHLTEALIQNGFSVKCLVRNPDNLRFLDVSSAEIIRGDCSRIETFWKAVKDVDYVFHLAGLTKAKSEEDFFIANVKGTENVVQAVLENNRNIKRFIYLSSLAAVGPSLNGRPHTEDCEPMPVSVYGRTKLQGEKIVLANKKEIPVTIIRPPAVYGPRDRDLLIFFKMINSGLIPYWGQCYYSFVYVEDLINGIILSAKSERAAGEIYFMTDGNIYTTNDIIEAITEALEKTPLRIRIPRFIMPLIGNISQLLRGVNIINTDKINEMRHSHWICDTGKAVSALNYEPKIKIREGVKWTANWYRMHKWI